MRIGFDMDGVLCTTDEETIQSLKRLDKTPERDAMEDEYYWTRRPLLNPLRALHEGDEGVVVTARSPRLARLTKEWLEVHYDLALPVIHIDRPTSHLPPYEWEKEVAWEKAKILADWRADVYFEDRPGVVGWLRYYMSGSSMATKIIQYGGAR